MRELTVTEMASVFGGEGCTGGASSGGPSGGAAGSDNGQGDTKGDRLVNSQRLGPALTEASIKAWYEKTHPKGIWDEVKAAYPTWQDLVSALSKNMGRLSNQDSTWTRTPGGGSK
ncbi:MAG: hypothetical protein E5X80_33050 [Mesorhizobium sp.]|uniref:hypothetical protein n=1 Tax=Mesorhizobium sp. TaxID=1871066 RepID=UPI000FE9F0AB|nr:hypothetical protein [Mesorhizobium sp.]RWM05022.1 MAG: hypothetical protein EOR71_25365 [Mesorhizobium sp.]TIO51259.1 MAG: hypothetical protein E5X78_17265 [Mesorhizobium sp.]TIO55884.1 MAG: hypothetical protein E5X79_33050 [Mesorhizobium sp.]TJV56141.1 MAG: hypothetical protein E5X80_33050 [Mesorhizobium sp.]